MTSTASSRFGSPTWQNNTPASREMPTFSASSGVPDHVDNFSSGLRGAARRRRKHRAGRRRREPMFQIFRLLRQLLLERLDRLLNRRNLRLNARIAHALLTQFLELDAVLAQRALQLRDGQFHFDAAKLSQRLVRGHLLPLLNIEQTSTGRPLQRTPAGRRGVGSPGCKSRCAAAAGTPLAAPTPPARPRSYRIEAFSLGRVSRHVKKLSHLVQRQYHQSPQRRPDNRLADDWHLVRLKQSIQKEADRERYQPAICGRCHRV